MFKLGKCALARLDIPPNQKLANGSMKNLEALTENYSIQEILMVLFQPGDLNNGSRKLDGNCLKTEDSTMLKAKLLDTLKKEKMISLLLLFTVVDIWLHSGRDHKHIT